MEITDELIACYVDGKLTVDEQQQVRDYLSSHPEEQERILYLMDECRDDSMPESEDEAFIVPDTDDREFCISANSSHFGDSSNEAEAGSFLSINDIDSSPNGNPIKLNISPTFASYLPDDLSQSAAAFAPMQWCEEPISNGSNDFWEKSDSLSGRLQGMWQEVKDIS